MKIWKLSPIDLGFADWCYSSYQNEAIVRAEDEKKAREIATLVFSNYTEKKSGSQETPRSPWDNSKVVKCIKLDNSNYPTDGPAELLEPADSDI